MKIKKNYDPISLQLFANIFFLNKYYIRIRRTRDSLA